MATTARPRPRIELDAQSTVLGELPLGNIQNIKPNTIDSLARQLDDFHIHCNDKENKPGCALELGSGQGRTTACETNHCIRGSSHAHSRTGTDCITQGSEDAERLDPLFLASQRLPSVQEQLSKHQEGQFEWLLSIPVKTSASGRRPRDDSHGDAELRRGEKTLYFGCNLVRRRTLFGGALGNDGESTDAYTILATRIEGDEDFTMDVAAERERTEATAQDGAVTGRHEEGPATLPKSPQLAVEVKEHSRPVSRIEDSVEALDKLEEEIEAVAQVTQLERVFSPENDRASTQNTNGAGAKASPLRRATSVRATASPAARPKTVERSASVRKAASSSSAQEDDKAVGGSSGSGARKVPRPASLLPPKPLAKSSKPPTVPAFELPGEAVARRLKEQREQRRSQQLSAEQMAAVAAAYSPSRPHFKSSKPPTRPTFELPGEAISRKKREEREAKLRAQEEEERKRREFKARPLPANLAPSTVPRETLTSLARQRQRQTEGSSDSAATTITPASKKRHSVAAYPSSSSAARPSTNAPAAATTTTTLPTRGRGPAQDTTDPAGPRTRDLSSRATSTSTGSGSIRRSGSAGSGGVSGSKRSVVSAEEAAAQRQRGREVFAADGAYAAARERERRAREEAAVLARREAAERSRMLSREWAEKQRLRAEREKEKRARERERDAGKAKEQAQVQTQVAEAA
ncbi:1ff71f15-ebca-414c-984f-9426cd9d1187 [Thermothielavioides terrestris]|uniref:1ff71f15-ebca-414c-984f-9426cd9d1187 n=1 Tax=Thermothielavioides terrestris TaxID=2587410 RepID=A0A446BYT9_9PEZI|nr:1ff71f15-ebca-414c-984f-9426cd9d1187 [Thermothielavioides terrestris]